MKSRSSTLSILFASLGMAIVQPVHAADFSGSCELFYKGKKVAYGDCTATQQGSVVSVKATVEENGSKYLAIINNDENSGALIGCGAFTLAEGALKTNEPDRIVFQNSYELRTHFD